MPNISRILGIARRALQAHQSAMNVASNNIANVNTEGYSRRRIELSAGRSIATPQGVLGSGVNIQGIERIRSSFIDQQLLNERPNFYQYEFKSTALNFIEDIFGEPSDFGLTRNMEDFFDSFHDLANDPESATARILVREKAVNLKNGFKRINRQLTDYRQQLNTELGQKVKEVNRLTTQIANLNEKIVNEEVGGDSANDLRDKRSLLLDKLSKLVDVKTIENASGGINVIVGGRHLVVDTQAQELALSVESATAIGPKVVFKNGGQVAGITNGSIKGILDIRDTQVADYLDQLDKLAVNIAQKINTIHSTGYNLDGITGTDLFDANVTGAADFELNPAIIADANLIAASDALNEPGNNNIALSLANLQGSLVMNDGDFTFSDFYNSLISSIGSQAQGSNFFRDSFAITVEKLEYNRESVSGVSLDEEMVNLIEAQQAFTAASRIVTTVDEMMQTILNMV
ncbi:MAG: flagellar hook-associated protein FlgK [Caldithrix sp.]|nr:MAG: flagellar hook-associated protein FlgK [Caldithrix sp.]